MMWHLLKQGYNVNDLCLLSAMKGKHQNALHLSGVLGDMTKKIIEMQCRKVLSIVGNRNPEIVYVKEG